MRHSHMGVSARVARWPIGAALAAVISARPAHAGTDAPWASFFDTFLGWLQGGTAIALITVAVLFAGYALMFKGEQGRGWRGAGYVAIGIALVSFAGAIAAEAYQGAGATLP